MSTILLIETPGCAMVDVTAQIAEIVSASNTPSGVVNLFIQHTSASLTIQENADPDVKRDLISWLDRIAPENGPYNHTAEGPDDMPAHIKSAITATSLNIPFADGKLLIGEWQGVYVLEHRARPHRRRVVASLLSAS